jgi:hypothetical protein
LCRYAWARDMWRVHLDRNEFSLALEHCAGADQRGGGGFTGLTIVHSL